MYDFQPLNMIQINPFTNISFGLTTDNWDMQLEARVLVKLLYFSGLHAKKAENHFTETCRKDIR